MIRFLLLISLLIFFSCEDTDTSSSEIELEEDCAGILGGENICGCMDSTAINYDSTATYDDGSCEYDTTITIFIQFNDPW